MDAEMIMENCPISVPTVHTYKKQLWCTNHGNLTVLFSQSVFVIHTISWVICDSRRSKR